MKFTEQVNKDGKIYKVEISTKDKFFSLTGAIYEEDKEINPDDLGDYLNSEVIEEGDKIYMLSMTGPLGDELIKVFPEYKVFNDLQLRDLKGVPLHFIDNCYYFIKKGELIKGDYGLTEKEVRLFNSSKDKSEFICNVVESGVLEKWKEKADKALKYLTELVN